MGTWPRKNLGEIVDFLSGFAWKAANFSDDRSGVPIIRIQNVDAVRVSDFVYWVDEYDSRFIVKEGDLLLTLSGSFRVEFWSGPNALLNQRIVKITPKSGIDSNWLMHSLRGALAQIEAMGRHALVNNVALSDLRQMELSLPPLEEQKRIAAILDQADEIRRKRQHAIERLNQLGQAIFKEMFEESLRSGQTDRICELASLMAVPLQNGAYFPKERYSDDGVEMVHMSDAFYGIIGRGNLKRADCTSVETEKCSLLPSDILVARRSLNIEGAAKPCLIPISSEPLIYESSFIRLRPDVEKIRTRYLYEFLSNSVARSTFINKYITQSTISGINQTNLARIHIFCPPLDQQDFFCCVVEEIDATLKVQKAHASKLEANFASLQHSAFTGQL